MVGARNGKAAASKSRSGSSQQPTASSSSPAPPPPAAPGGRADGQRPVAGPAESISTRQRRVLPARTRRGGPGVGSCESDLMILETMKRRFESEPLIPATTPFLLTTNSTLISSLASDAGASTSEAAHAQLNTLAYSRYFDRPEVRKAYMEQQLIQTPEFTELPQDAHVGGRFRPRNSEDDTADTSDAAYEKRHRKYETFEKRQRLREKEKLKHEHYKLKERIEQLRAMDSSAFLAIPASEFADTPGCGPEAAAAAASGDAANLHGAAAYHEGERRRKVMLDVAMSLEERYRTLLPPDRRWMEKKGTPKGKGASVEVVEVKHEDDTVEVEEDAGVEELPEKEEVEEDAGEEEMEEEDELIEDEADDDGESEVDPDESDRRKSKQLKLRIKFPPRMLSSKRQSPNPLPTRGGGKQITLSPFFKHTSGGKGHTTSSPLRSASYVPTDKYGRYSEDPEDALPPPPSAKRQRIHDESASAAIKAAKSAQSSKWSKAPKAANGIDKRHTHSAESRTASSAGRPSPTITSASAYSARRSYTSYAGLAGKKDANPCVLMVAALRQSSAPTARKTQRHVTAFGCRVPQEIEEVRDFEIPEWVLVDESASQAGGHHGDREGSYSTHNEHGEDESSIDDSGT
ncbi:hypothetical protein BD311DRAFT_833127 [Dichomitus squalens]|uniref:PEHE domain-containing protein n=1 Tax=Dichomitus squalens TaxID=114155 RepID=A0A4Q9MQL5_9APHY|nr:hypothetical protein BD311DRAFT_833127 [Dichomitus squalens]